MSVLREKGQEVNTDIRPAGEASFLHLTSAAG